MADCAELLEPPAAYTVRRVTLEALSPDEAVAHLLGVYSQCSGGSFPSRLDDWDSYWAMFARLDLKARPEAESLKLMQSFALVVKFVHEGKTPYGYEAAGAKFGDSDRIIFWYRPSGSPKFRVVYADLRTGDVTADKLPETPKR
jgi:hypothetical protein